MGDLDAAEAALNAAGARQADIDGRIAVLQGRLDELAEARQNKGRGRPNTAHTSERKAVEAKIARLQRNLLPGEPDPRPPRPQTVDELRTSAAQNAQHHAAAGTAPLGRPAGNGGVGDGGDGNGGGGAAARARAAADANDDDVEDANFQQYYAVSPAQKAFNNDVAREYIAAKGRHMPIKVQPKNVISGFCQPALIGLGPVHICAPHYHLGLPLPPCPRHGWRSVDHDKLHTNGVCPARRVYAQTEDEWLVGVHIICELCKEEKADLEMTLMELEDDDNADEADLIEARQAVMQATYSYRSYNPKSLELYAQRYYWYVASLPYIVVNKRTALTRPLARRIMRACTSGSNATDLAEELLELKAEWFDLLRAQVVGMHLWAADRSPGQQLTLEQTSMGAYSDITHKSVAFCAPGLALIQHFYLAVSDAEKEYKFSWRQQNVGVTVGALDATMKRGSALADLKIRQTLWSNDLQAPLIAVFVNSASMEDPAFTSACKVYNQVVIRCGMEPMRLLYLDCPFRDGPGAARRLPSLTRPHTDAELDYRSDHEEPYLVDAISKCDRWCKQFDRDDVVELGLDVEWRAPQRSGDTRGKVATLQLVSLRCGGQDKVMGAIFCLTGLGVLPPSLIALLNKARVGGVNIKEDIAKLETDRLPTPGPSQLSTSEVIELAPLASDVLRIPPSQVTSLEKVLARCCPGRSLNKRLVDVRRENWEAWPLPIDAQRYAINDAYASALALRRLRHPDLRATLPPPPPPQPAAAAADTHAAAGVIDQMDDDLRAQVFGDQNAGDDDDDDEEPRGDPFAESHHATLFQVACDYIVAWKVKGDTDRAIMPAFVTGRRLRAALHAFCEEPQINLAHDTIDVTEENGETTTRFVVRRRTGPAAAGSGGDGATGFTTDNILMSLAFDEGWQSVLVKYDIRHWMGNWFLMAQSKSSPFFKYFCVATSDAVFQVWKGDASIPGTRDHVEAHLRKRFKHGINVDMTNPEAKKKEDERVDGLIKRMRRGYWRKHCRFTIAPPKELAQRLLSVYYFFSKLKDPETGNDFFSPGHEAICRKELAYVAKGELSDHPTIPLYIQLRTTKTGLAISRCLRTSSGLEGYHQHLENAVSKCGKAAGQRYTEATTNEFDWRWTVRAVRKAGLIPKWVHHYNLPLIEYLYDTAIKLRGPVGGQAVVEGWRRTKLMTTPLLKHGMHYGYEAQKHAAPAAAADAPKEPMGGEAGWVAEQMGSPRPLHYQPTAGDVDALMGARPPTANDQDAAGVTAEQLNEVAWTRGLHLPTANAERWMEEVTTDEAARVMLNDEGYAGLQQQLRTRVDPPAVMEATVPPVGQANGADDLPGPQPGMGMQVVEAAQLEPMEEEEGGEAAADGDFDDNDGAPAEDDDREDENIALDELRAEEEAEEDPAVEEEAEAEGEAAAEEEEAPARARANRDGCKKRGRHQMTREDGSYITDPAEKKAVRNKKAKERMAAKRAARNGGTAAAGGAAPQAPVPMQNAVAALCMLTRAAAQAVGPG